MTVPSTTDAAHDAMTADPAAAEGASIGDISAAPDRTVRDDLRLARIHLRMGQLLLARAELEDLFARDALDVAGLAGLAEARWRTGEGPGAAEAAQAHLEAGGSDDVALCIAAEAVAADGRSDDARALMDRLPVADAATLDALFAGMPRRAFWPAGPVDRSDLDELRRETDARVAAGRRGTTGMRDAAVAGPPMGGVEGGASSSADGTPDARRAVPGPREVIEATGGAEWEAAIQRSTEDTQVYTTRPPADRPRTKRAKAQLDPAAELARAREELGSNPEQAFLRLSLVLRHDPTLAPSVLEALRLRREPNAALVRGDAQRLLGRHLEAEAAFDAAAESLEVS